MDLKKIYELLWRLAVCLVLLSVMAMTVAKNAWVLSGFWAAADLLWIAAYPLGVILRRREGQRPFRALRPLLLAGLAGFTMAVLRILVTAPR